MSNNPPKYFLRFFRWFCHPELKKYIEGDLMELYDERVRTLGRRKADLKFTIDVLLLFRPGIIRPVKGRQNLNTYGMYKSYLKIGWRNLLKNKGYSYINMLGLALGMAVTILIGVWVFDEISFDKNHLNYNRIAEVYQHKIVNDEIQTTVSPAPMADELRNSFKDDFKNVVRMWWQSSHTLAIQDLRISKVGTFLEKGGLELFSFPMTRGSWQSLNDPASIILSESTAKALFGDQDPINQTLRIDNMIDVKVTGIYKELPKNSTFHAWQFVSSYDLWVSSNKWMKAGENNWNENLRTFVEIQPTTSFENVSKKIQKIKFKNLPPEQAVKEIPALFLQPMSRWHLYQWKNGKEIGGRIQFVWLFGIIGSFVLILACINFTNLSTAQSQMRAKEVGIRKSVGSARGQLISQFFIETFVVVLLSFVIALSLASVAMPWFNEFADKDMSIPWSDSRFIIISLGFVLFTGIMAGSYPALLLSSFHPIKVLKGTFKSGRFANSPRRVLVVVQFVVSVSLIIGTIAVWRQIQFAKDRPVGYTREGLIMVRKNSTDFWGKINPLRNKLKSEDAIVELVESASPATENWFTNDNFNWPGKDPNVKIDFTCTAVSHNYGKVMEWSIVSGRDFSRDYSTDSSAIILNETAARIIGWENPIDEEIIFEGRRYNIIGVLQDMIVDSPYENVKPGVYFLQNDHTLNSMGNVWLTLKLNPDLSTHEAISRVEKVFRTVLPGVAFNFKFVDQEYENKFSSEERIGKLATLFALLAIFISCLGLFGLASFVAQQRTKEIGIRKVLGASVFNLWKMLSKDFVVLVMISCLIAIPIAHYFLIEWLEKYEYRTEISWWIFALSSFSALGITLFTVSFQAVKAAMMNPVNSLRSE